MDESDVDIYKDANIINVLREGNEEFMDDLVSGNRTDVHQKEDGLNDFESLTRPISSAASGVSNALEDRFLKSNSGEEKRDDDIYNQNIVEASGKEIFDATVPNDSLEHEASIENVSDVDPSAEVPAGPRSPSPDFGNDPFHVAEEIRTLHISRNYSEVDVDCVDQLNVSFPEVPTDDPVDLFDRSSIDGGGSPSIASSHSFSQSYLYSSVSVGEDIPNLLQDGGDHLIPKYKADGRGFCWPVDKLPLSGERKFEEGAQWEISKKIGHGASGQCFLGYPVGEENPFCVKKCKYNEEELKALCLAAKAEYSKENSEGAKKIVLLYGATYYKPDVCIFMKYMEGGTVQDAIIEAKTQLKNGLHKIECSHYFKDVLLALEFIHRKGIVHNDVKVDNVLLTAYRLEAKLCDFGKATAISEHNPASKDVWSGGCFLLEMLGKKYSKALMSGFLKKSNVLDRDRLPEDVEQDTYEVLSKCFCAERNKYTVSDVLNSAFLNV